MWTFLWGSFIAGLLIANHETAVGFIVFAAALAFLVISTVLRARAGGAL